MAGPSKVKMRWTERKVGYSVMHHLMERAAIVVPNCNWTGSEADLLVVTRDRRLVDIEIKVDRSDFKADGTKSKWQSRFPQRKPEGGAWSDTDFRKLWPEKVWKHYYVVPMSIWDDSLLEFVSPASGIILIDEHEPLRAYSHMRVRRHAKPQRGAPAITEAQAMDIGRLASLRYWDLQMKTDLGQRLGMVRVADEHLRSIRNGFPPQSEYVEVMKDLLVLDVQRDFAKDQTSFFCYSEKFDVLKPGEKLPEYVAVIRDGKILAWERQTG